MSRRPTLDDVFVLREGGDILEDEGYCMGGSCGETFKPGDKCVYVPAGWGPRNAIIAIHLHCAVRGEEIELTGTISP